jgi:YbgC/YbaW family acyl-CoA thioester hydrolase
MYLLPMPFFVIRKKVHWSDSDAAGVVWFPNFLGWFEDAEEELYAALGKTRQALLDELSFAMPRVEAHIRFASPARPGQTIRVGVNATIVNPRRMKYTFEMRDDATGRLLASGTVRVASVDLRSFTPRDFPKEIIEMIGALPGLIERQSRGEAEIPWT